MIVCATIVKNNEVLLVKHSCEQKSDSGDWLLPAGRPETGERLEEALKREINEELRLEVEIVRKITEHIDPYTSDNLVNFLCAPRTSEIEPSSELAEAKWFNLERIQEVKDIEPNSKQFLVEVLEP